MIVDAHCHLWRRWPYDSAPPTAGCDGGALAAELAANGVDRAVVVAAAIGEGEHANARNTADVADAVRARPGALQMFADVDSRWSPTYHRPGAAERLEATLASTGARAFAHYLDGADDGWFGTSDGDAFLAAAVRRGAVAGVHAPPPWYAAIGAAAARHPDLTLLLHHQGLAATDDEVDALVELARHPGVAIKVSGFRYVSAGDPPYADVRPRLSRLARAFGPHRMAWGSDWPVSTRHHTYADAIAFADEALAFLDDSERSLVFGGTILTLLRWES